MSGAVWKYLGGKTRRYLNTVTGEEISRRQYDQRYGNLKHIGGNAYAKKAAATRERTPELADKRPARGKSVRQVKNLRTLSPTIGKVGRTIADGNTAESYDVMLAELKKNKKIYGALAGSYYERTDDTTGSTARWVKWLPNRQGDVVLSDLDLLLPGDEAEYITINNLFSNKQNSVGRVTGEYENFLYFVFYVRFHSDIVKPKPEPTRKQINKRQRENYRKRRAKSKG